jgi:ribosomal-protein-alanine N-acetyltransferase
MQITFGEYSIRSFYHSDKTALIKYANNPNISRFLRDQFPFPYTSTDADSWLMAACNQKIESSFAIANDRELIGAIGINIQDDVNRYSAEIGYWIAEPFWRKGIATNALKKFTDYTFNNFDINRIFANVFEGNLGSEKVLLKSGYKKEATLKQAVYKGGKFLDQYIYAILKKDFRALK